jgi:hypothetical protein
MLILQQMGFTDNQILVITGVIALIMITPYIFSNLKK